jgi:ABC-type transport system involved in multi-copper enzyme maturation permease subunit
VPPDIERRTIFTILSKPVNRLEFLLGKFLGLCLTLAVNLALMSVMFILSYILFQLRKSGWNWGAAWAVDPSSGLPGLGFDVSNLSRALTLQFGQLTIMAALALTLSLVVSNITAIVFCFLAYFGGQTSSYWEHLGSEHGGDEHGDRPGLSGPVARLVQMVYYVLPRLDRFEVRERLVNDMAIGSNYMWKAFDSGLIYVAVLLTIAYLIFSDREF